MHVGLDGGFIIIDPPTEMEFVIVVADTLEAVDEYSTA